MTSLSPSGVAAEETHARSSKMALTGVSWSTEAIACVGGEPAEQTKLQNPNLWYTGVRLMLKESLALCS